MDLWSKQDNSSKYLYLIYRALYRKKLSARNIQSLLLRCLCSLYYSMFKMTKNMAAILVAIMLLAQIGIAQHNVVHFTDHGHYEHSHDDQNDDHQKNVSETCQICLLAKSLSFGLLPYSPALNAPVLSSYTVLNSHDQVVAVYKRALYNPRAPPVLLV